MRRSIPTAGVLPLPHALVLRAVLLLGLALATAAAALPAAADGVSSAGSIIPTHLAIPSIGVNAPLEQVGLTADRTVESPQQWMDAAWYDLGYQPGATGNAAIIGHLDSTTGPAVFWRLGALQPGAKVLVDDGTTTLTFLVQSTTTYPDGQAPMQQIYGSSDAPHLNLITCSGDWNPATHRYSDRLVVYTVLQGSQADTSAAACRFVLGFQAIHDMIPSVVGGCTANEGHNAQNGDALQQTSGGLLVWRKADNWTAFTDGFHTWVNGPNGLQERLNSQRFSFEANPDGLPLAQ